MKKKKKNSDYTVVSLLEKTKYIYIYIYMGN